MKRTLLFLSSLLLLSSITALAQSKSECINEVLSYDSMNKPKADSAGTQNTFVSYVLRVTNWDDETTTSNVKMYKKGDNMNFFSEQANIYMDEKEVLIIMPEQKVMVINTLNKQNKGGLNDDFFEMRRAFIDSCQVIKCEQKSPVSKTLVLKSRTRMNGLSSIESMTYEYNPAAKKIISVNVKYYNSYKLKQLVMVFKEYNPVSAYKFLPVKKYYSDRRGNINENYKDFEIVDNRDEKPTKKGKEKS